MRKISMLLIGCVLIGVLSGCNSEDIKIPIEDLTAKQIQEFAKVQMQGHTGEMYDDLSITDMKALEISESNATLDGNVYYKRVCPYEVGVLFSEIDDVDSFEIIGVDLIKHKKNPFDMWYNLNGECNTILESNTTYYYKFFAVIDTNGDGMYNDKSDVIVLTTTSAFTTLDSNNKESQ